MELKHQNACHCWPLALLLFAGPVSAQAAQGAYAAAQQSPVNAYRNSTQHELAQCSEAFRLSFRRFWLTRAASDYRACIRKAQDEANAKLAVAAEAVRKADARRALIAYHTAFLAAISGIEPHADEPAEGYEQRQSLLLHAMSHAWSRYELVE